MHYNGFSNSCAVLSFIIIWDALWLHSSISVQVTSRSHMICQSESNYGILFVDGCAAT